MLSLPPPQAVPLPRQREVLKKQSVQYGIEQVYQHALIIQFSEAPSDEGAVSEAD